MAISQKDIKILWGKSGNRCAICKQELAYTEATSSNNVLIGEQAHIVAQKEGGPRGNSNLSLDERDSYPNLILLCANHHTIIDADAEKYSIEKLHQIKREHELWVSEKLSSVASEHRQAEDEIYATLIDAVVEKLDLINWEGWSSFAVSSSNILLPSDMIDSESFELRILVEKAIFSGRFLELEKAIVTLSHIFLATANIFLKHCKKSGQYYQEDRFYKITEWNDEKYNNLLRRYEKWRRVYLDCFYDLARTLNWFADVVRRDINPFFFSKEGRFTIVEGDVLGYTPNIYQFTESEKEKMPQLILDKLSEINVN